MGRLAENALIAVDGDLHFHGDFAAIYGALCTRNKFLCDFRLAVEQAEVLRQAAEVTRGESEPASGDA